MNRALCINTPLVIRLVRFYAVCNITSLQRSVNWVGSIGRSVGGSVGRSLNQSINQSIKSKHSFPILLVTPKQTHSTFTSYTNTDVVPRSNFVVYACVNGSMVTMMKASYVVRISEAKQQFYASLVISQQISVCNSITDITRKLCYRKDDRAMRPTYECPENFWDFLTPPTATIPNIFMGFCSDRPYECSYKN